MANESMAGLRYSQKTGQAALLDSGPAIFQKEVWYAFEYEEDLGRGLQGKVALEALKTEKTIAQIASGNRVHPNQVRQGRKHLLEALPEVFSTMIRLTSSGIVRLIFRIPASMWTMGILNWAAANAPASVEFVSPRTIT